MVDLRGFELNQIKAKVALKVLDIEQLGLPSQIRTCGMTEHLAILLTSAHYILLLPSSRSSNIIYQLERYNDGIG